MSAIVSTGDVAGTLADPRVSTGTAVGYEVRDLVEGDIAQAWRSDLSAGTHDVDIRISSGVPPTFAAIFDARGEPLRNLYSIEIYRGFGWPISSSFLQTTVAPNGRGDACALLGALSGAAALRFRFIVAGGAKISVGRIWVGTHTTLPRSYAQRTDSPEYAVIENTSEARSAFAHELADLVEKFRLGFGRLTRAERDAVRAVFAATRGSRHPLVLVPDHTRMGEVYHGRIGKSLPHQVDFPEFTGLSWDFVESGRGLG